MRESKPKCPRCGESDFVKPGAKFCTDCARWLMSLGQEARADDALAWGKKSTSRISRPKDDNRDPLERFGFTKLSDIKADT